MHSRSPAHLLARRSSYSGVEGMGIGDLTDLVSDAAAVINPVGAVLALASSDASDDNTPAPIDVQTQPLVAELDAQQDVTAPEAVNSSDQNAEEPSTPTPSPSPRPAPLVNTQPSMPATTKTSAMKILLIGGGLALLLAGVVFYVARKRKKNPRKRRKSKSLAHALRALHR
jgi:LPXTG-motif cell wall-anchored protein